MSSGDQQIDQVENLIYLKPSFEYDADNELVWIDETSNQELVYLKSDGTSVRRQSILDLKIKLYSTKYEKNK